MNNYTFLFLACFLTATINVVQAESIYKCKNSDGSFTYQSQKCENSGKKIELAKNRFDSFVGCYIWIPPPKYENRKHVVNYNVKYKVQKLDNGRYEIYQFDDRELLTYAPLREATSEELSKLSNNYGYTYQHGLNLYWNPEEHKVKDPGLGRWLGIYKIKDKKNNEFYVTHMAFKGGFTEQVECDASLNNAVIKNSQQVTPKPLKKSIPEPVKRRPVISNGCDKADLNNGKICVGKIIKGANNANEAKEKYLQDTSLSLRIKNLIIVASEQEYIKTGSYGGNACSVQQEISRITPTDSVACEAWNSSWYCKQTFKWACSTK